MRLTEKRIRDTKADGTETFLWDDEVPGLAVRVRAKSKSYVLRYRVGGGRRASQRRSALGKCSVLSLSDARAMAREYLLEVAKGGDPFGQRPGIAGGFGEPERATRGIVLVAGHGATVAV